MLDVSYRHQEPTRNVTLLSEKDVDQIFRDEFGERWDTYRRAWYSAGAWKNKLDFPLSLEFETNNTCNYRCHMCSFAAPELHPDHWNDVSKGFLSMDLYKRLIDEGSEHGLPAATYGFHCEPLQHPDLHKMVSYARKKNVFDLRVGTNGHYLTKDVSRQLVDAGLTRLEVSLDALDEETFDKVRVGGDFNTVFKNIHDFLEIRNKSGSVFPLLRVSFIKLNVNKHQLEGFMDYWKEYADYFSIQEPIDYVTDGNNMPLSPQLAGTALRFQSKEKPGFQCAKITHRMYIRFNGMALPCGFVQGWDDMYLGDLNEQSASDIWTCDKFNDLRKLHGAARYMDNPTCHNCVLRTEVEELDQYGDQLPTT